SRRRGEQEHGHSEPADDACRVRGSRHRILCFVGFANYLLAGAGAIAALPPEPPLAPAMASAGLPAPPARTAATSATVTGSPLLPKLLRTNVSAPAICASVSPSTGISALNVWPFTVTLPFRPFIAIPIERCLSAIRKSDLASGGNTPGTPLPSGWW